MFGIYEDLYGPPESNTGAYLILAIVAFMVLRAAPAFLKEVLPNFRIYPLFAGGIAFWWLTLSGRYVIGFLAMMAGIVISHWLMPTTEEKKPDDSAIRPQD